MLSVSNLKWKNEEIPNLTEASSPPLPPSVALAESDTASPPDREIATCVLARTTPFLCDCQTHTHTHDPGGPW